MSALEKRILLWAMVFLAALVLGMVAKKGVQQFRKGLAEKNPERDTSQLAVRYKEAFNPYFWGVGTDVQALFQLAQESRGIFNEVSRNYKNRYGTALDEDLSDDLNSDDLATFYQILKS